METIYRALVVGCGNGDAEVGVNSIGYWHGMDYAASARAELVGACDLNATNLEKFMSHFQLSHGSKDLAEVLRSAKPDVVSICTYAASHLPILRQCLAAGVRGFWCEKPMALTFDEGQEMIELLDKADARMIVNHCRRFLPAFQEVKSLLRSGTIGKVVLYLASQADWDQMEFGTHWHDMFRFFADDAPIEWVMGTVRCSGGKKNYGHLMEEHSVGFYAFADGSRALYEGGHALTGSQPIRVIGTDGILDLAWDGTIRVINSDGKREWQASSTMNMPGFGNATTLQIIHSLFDWMEEGPESQLSARNALKSSEIYMACYESALRRDRIDLPMKSQRSFPLDEIASASIAANHQHTSPNGHL